MLPPGKAEMGVQQFSRRKVECLNCRWGWHLDMIWNTQGMTEWYEARTLGDHHVIVNVRTGRVLPGPERVIHMSSCRRLEGEDDG